MPTPPVTRAWLVHFHARKYLILLLCLLVLVIVRPLVVRDFVTGTVFETIGSLLVLGFLALTGHKRSFWICSGLVLAAAITSSLYYSNWEQMSSDQRHLMGGTSIIIAIAFLCFVSWLILRDVFNEPSRTWDNINGALSVYLLTGFVFANLYLAIYLANPESFNMKRPETPAADPTTDIFRTDFIYYSFVTLSTLGYGDISPTTPMARTLSWLEAVSGQLYLAVLVARLIAVQQTPRRSEA
jgi:hypothetical protein